MWYSVQFRVMLIVGIILLASIALLLILTAGTYERQLLQHAILHTNRIGDLAARSISSDMVAHRTTEILTILDTYAQEDELEKIRLFDKEGTIVLSTERSETDDKVDMTAEMCIKCHNGGAPKVMPPPLERGRIFLAAGGSRRLATITPIYNAPPCYGCHDRKQKVLGVLDAVFSLEAVDASIQRVRRAAMISGAAALLFAWIGVAFVVQRFVRQPVKRLLQATQRVAEGDLDFQLTVSSQDELGKLCAAFNVMSARLQKAADEHVRWNKELENKVKTATKELEKANESLRAADRRRAEFIRTVIHQLRAPVSGMQSFLRLITNRIVGDLTPKQQEMLDRVDRKCSLLLGTVNDLLDMAAVSEDGIQRPAESVDLCDLAARCVNQFSHLADKKGIQLLFERESQVAPVVASVRDLQYAVSNLLSNAVHYTLEGTVRVRVGQRNDQVVLVVCDTGIGIPEDDIPQCFREFYRGENATQHFYEGSGLGLSIVQKVVDKYGGEITLESKLGIGTTVTVTLPARRT